MLLYPGVTDWGASGWAWRDRQGWTGPIWGVIHATASPGSSARDVFNYFMGNAGACSHFVIGKAGDVYQCADPRWAAGANCCPSPPSPAVQWFGGTNANYGTWSIEILKNDTNNTDVLPEAQFTAVVSVSKWLCSQCGTATRWADAQGGIMSHSFLDPVHRPGDHDPGPFDWNRYFSTLQQGGGIPTMTIFSNEVCIAVWNSYFASTGKGAPPRETGIFKSWRALWIAGTFKGCPLGGEYDVTLPNGHGGKAQNYAGGTCIWDLTTSIPTWI